MQQGALSVPLWKQFCRRSLRLYGDLDHILFMGCKIQSAGFSSWVRYLACLFTKTSNCIVKTAGRNPMFMSPPIHEYSCAMGSSAIIRYYCYIPCTSTLLQATACHIFHTLYVLSFLICY